MKKSKFTEEQTAFALRQAESGTRVAEVCRKIGIAEQTFLGWKKEYGGLRVSELRRLRQFEEENLSPAVGGLGGLRPSVPMLAGAWILWSTASSTATDSGP